MLTRHPFPSGRRGFLDEKNYKHYLYACVCLYACVFVCMHVFVCMYVCLFDDHI